MTGFDSFMKEIEPYVKTIQSSGVSHKRYEEISDDFHTIIITLKTHMVVELNPNDGNHKIQDIKYVGLCKDKHGVLIDSYAVFWRVLHEYGVSIVFYSNTVLVENNLEGYTINSWHIPDSQSVRIRKPKEEELKAIKMLELVESL